MITVPVDLGDRSYDVIVGAGARHRLLEVVPPHAQRAAIVTQPDLPVTADPGIEHQTFLIDQGEDAKKLETIEQLCRQFSRWGLTRTDLVIAVGGGVVTDAAGFAAAVYHRGVPVIHVATSLLAQVDAAIGGKTGVNLPEGKNLVGAFWQPTAVLCDTETLQTLPPREYRSGLGEIAKYHFLGAEDLADCNLEEKVARCVALKAKVVAEDEREREGDKRALLNYGHTLAHALETDQKYDLRHGEAVAIGLVYAAQLAHALGRIDAARIDDHRKVLASYDLPMDLPDGSNADDLVKLMLRDKKATDGLTFVLDGPAGVEVVKGVPERIAADVLRTTMGAS